MNTVRMLLKDRQTPWAFLQAGGKSAEGSRRISAGFSEF